MVEHIDWKWLDPDNGERGADMDGFCKEISKIRELGISVIFEVIRGLYNEQERAVKILGHQVVDGVAQKRKARRTLANEQGGQTQYKVQWANTIVLKEPLNILQDRGYSTSRLRPAPEFACMPATSMLDLVEASWEPTWEPEDVIYNMSHIFGLYKNTEQTSCLVRHHDCGRMMWMVINLPGSSKDWMLKKPHVMLTIKV